MGLVCLNCIKSIILEVLGVDLTFFDVLKIVFLTTKNSKQPKVIQLINHVVDYLLKLNNKNYGRTPNHKNPFTLRNALTKNKKILTRHPLGPFDL